LTLKGNGHILVFVCTSHEIWCLQVETCDDTGGNSASDESFKRHDIVSNSDMPAIKQVNNSIPDGF